MRFQLLNMVNNEQHDLKLKRLYTKLLEQKKKKAHLNNLFILF